MVALTCFNPHIPIPQTPPYPHCDPSPLAFDLTDVLACGSLGCSMKRASSLGVLNEPDKPVDELNVRPHPSLLFFFLSSDSFLFSFSPNLFLLCLHLEYICSFLSPSVPPVLCFVFLAHLSGTFQSFSLILCVFGGIYNQHTHSSIITILTHVNECVRSHRITQLIVC